MGISTVIAGISAATAIAGTAMSASASSRAISAQKQAQTDAFMAQDRGFWERAKASNVRLASEGLAQNQAMGAQQEAFDTQRQQETTALQQRQQTVDQENQQATQIRQQADAQRAQLLAATDKTALDKSQATMAANINANIAPSAANIETSSPLAHPSDTQGGEASTKAYATRLKEAADNVRSYGQRLATVASYTAPLTTVGQSIEQEKSGIMPTAVANQLLQSGQQIRLLPSDTAYSIAGSEGAAKQAQIRAKLQSDLGLAGTAYQGATNVADLEQGDTTTLASNRAEDAKMTAQQTQALGSLISGIGQLGVAGAGRYSGWLDALGGGQGFGAAINAPPPTTSSSGWK